MPFPYLEMTLLEYEHGNKNIIPKVVQIMLETNWILVNEFGTFGVPNMAMNYCTKSSANCSRNKLNLVNAFIYS